MNSHKIKILVVEDEELIAWSLTKQLEKEGYEVITALTGEDGLELFNSESPEVVLLDHRLPGANGLVILTEIKQRNPSCVVIMMTAHGKLSTAVQAIKLGAHEYIKKPIDFDELKLHLTKALKTHKIEGELASHRRELKAKYGFSSIIGNSPPMQAIFQIIRKVSFSEAATVLIEGDSGTGKELVARAIHYESKRADKPFVPINCSALPESLLESELFGFEKGAFTDAKQAKKGQFELAEEGTIFLDEIGEITLATQVKLLRLLETRTFKRIGGVSDIKINVRIIAATNLNLDKALVQGIFRQDLYYRLKVIYIQLPRLRERPEDVPILAKYFIDIYNREFSKNVLGIDPEAEKMLRNYDWPGNVRELRNVIERILILENDPYILPEHFPAEMRNLAEGSGTPSNMVVELPDEGFPLDEMEKLFVEGALTKATGNQTHAAKLLSISRDALRYKMKKYGLLS